MSGASYVMVRTHSGLKPGQFGLIRYHSDIENT